jgi:hypothetical protein
MVLGPSPRNQVDNKAGRSARRWRFELEVPLSHYLQPDPRMSNVKNMKMGV